jgi:hypothetical protein
MARDARGRFVAGPDQSRHQFTAQERQRGYRSTRFHTDPKLAAWIWRKMRSAYRKAGTYYPQQKGEKHD